MTLQAFIEKGIAGGWVCKACDEPEKNYPWFLHEILFDPAFWRAVGKKSWWNVRHSRGNHSDDSQDTEPCDCTENEWKKYMHRFLDFLIEADANGIPQEEAIRKFVEGIS